MRTSQLSLKKTVFFFKRQYSATQTIQPIARCLFRILKAHEIPAMRSDPKNLTGTESYLCSSKKPVLQKIPLCKSNKDQNATVLKTALRVVRWLKPECNQLGSRILEALVTAAVHSDQKNRPTNRKFFHFPKCLFNFKIRRWQKAAGARFLQYLFLLKI